MRRTWVLGRRGRSAPRPEPPVATTAAATSTRPADADDAAAGPDAAGPRTGGRPLFIVHLMKTGGTSLLYQVFANVRQPSIWGVTDRPPPDLAPEAIAARMAQLDRYTSVERLQAIDADVRAATEVVVGHLPFVAVELAGFHQPTVATVLRDPVDRVVSFMKACQAAYPEHQGRPLEAVWEDEFLAPRLLRDHQTRMLGMTVEQATVPEPKVYGPPHPDVVARLMQEGYFQTARYVLEVLDTPLVWPTPVDRTTLDAARRNLERVDVLGVHEAYDDFLARLARRMGWTVDPGVRLNQGEPATIPEGLRRRIEEGNALDLELYEHARALVRRASGRPGAVRA